MDQVVKGEVFPAESIKKSTSVGGREGFMLGWTKTINMFLLLLLKHSLNKLFVPASTFFYDKFRQKKTIYVRNQDI